MAEAQASPADSGKAFVDSAEAAYDEIADREGIDEYGDDFPDDDEPVLVDDDEPVVEASDEDDQDEYEEPEAAEPVRGDDLIPPHAWRAEWKEAFNRVTDPQLRKILLEQNSNMNRAFTQKMTELAGYRKQSESLVNAVRPHHDRLSRAGIQPEVAIQRSLAWDAHIQADPVRGISDMAKAYGVDLTQVAQGNQDMTQYMTPTEKALYEQNQGAKSEVQHIKQQFQGFQRQQQQREWSQRQGTAYGMLDRFMNAKDEQGNQLHPYIEHVAPHMAQMINNNEVQNLEQAYQEAVWRNPDVREALLKKRQADTSRNNQRQVQKVRKASSSGIVNKRSGKPGKRVRTTEEQVLAAYNSVRNA